MSEMIWNFDIDQAPKGYYETKTKVVGKNKTEVETTYHVPELIIAAGNDGVVTLSKWLPESGRWNMFSKNTPPLAWMPWPAHPHTKQEVQRCLTTKKTR